MIFNFIVEELIDMEWNNFVLSNILIYGGSTVAIHVKSHFRKKEFVEAITKKMNVLAMLEKLREDGVLTAAEFAEKKKIITEKGY